MNFSGHFLLTKLLLNKMIETAKKTGVQGRIVNVSSTIHSWFSGDVIRYLGLITRNKRWEKNIEKFGMVIGLIPNKWLWLWPFLKICVGVSSQYDATRAYAVSKLANVLHTKELAQRLKVIIKIHWKSEICCFLRFSRT